MKSLKELMDLTGRVAVITGGAGHVGRAIGEGLAELGASVVPLDLSETRCAEVAGDLRERYRVDCRPLALDLVDEAALRRVPEQVSEWYGRLDVLVHCAALVGTSELKGWATRFPEHQPEAWRRALEVNLTSPFILTQACAPLLAEGGRGSVIHISSIYGMVGPDERLYEGTSMAMPAAYAASKGGLIQFTRYLATVLAPRIRVNTLSLGGIWRQQPEAFTRRYEERTPLRRMGAEQDVKGAAAFLASDLSEYVTGQNLAVDGGWTAW